MRITENELKSLIRSFLREQLEFPTGKEIDQKIISLKNKLGEDITEAQYENGVAAWAEIYDGVVRIIQDVKQMIPSVVADLKNLAVKIPIPDNQRNDAIEKFQEMLNKINKSGAADAFLSYGVLDSEKVVRSFFSEFLMLLGAPGATLENDKAKQLILVMLSSGPSILSAIQNALNELREEKPVKNADGKYSIPQAMIYLYKSSKMLLNLSIKMTESGIDTQYMLGAMELRQISAEDMIFLKFYYFFLVSAQDIFLLPENLINKALSALEKGSFEVDDPIGVKLNVLDNL